jgi:hypothetical protein
MAKKVAAKKAVETKAVEQPTAVVEQPKVDGEALALAWAKSVWGDDARVWSVTQDLTGKDYKAPRYRVGYKVEKQAGRFIELGRYMKGIGPSWSAALSMAKGYVAADVAKAAEAAAAAKKGKVA